MNRRILALLMGFMIMVTVVSGCAVYLTTSAESPHDIAVSIEIPNELFVGEIAKINVTIRNIGTVDEANVVLSVTINRMAIRLRASNLLSSNSSVVVPIDWNATPIGSYNITVYVPPVKGEMSTDNNRESRIVNVVSPRILIVSDDDGPTQVGYKKGTSLPEFEDALCQSVTGRYDLWKESERGHPSLEILTKYQLVIWTCGDFNDLNAKVPDRIDSKTLEDYLNQGGNILVEGQRICWNRAFGIDAFAGKVLHVDYEASIDSAPLQIVDSSHPIVANLPMNLSWVVEPKDYADSVEAVNGGQKIIGYGNRFQRGAAVVFDGAKMGIGSVVVYSFPIYWLSSCERNVLVLNSVAWLTRFDLELVMGKMTNAQAYSIRFVYTDPDELGGTATFDAAAGAMVYSVCQNPQSQGLSSTRNWFLPSGQVNFTEINQSIIVIAGNPANQRATEFYENAKLSPIKSSQNSTHYLLENRAGEVLVAIPKIAIYAGQEDLLVIQVFKDGNKTMVTLYGFSWRGTWAAGMYFAEVMTMSLSKCSKACYLLRWEDTSMDGIPQTVEINEIEFG